MQWLGIRVPFEESHANVRELLLSANKYKMILLGPPPVGEDEQNERIRVLSQAFAEDAAAMGVPYIDLFSPLVSDPAYKREVMNNDGAHPGRNGYKKMAQIVSSSPSWWFYVL